MTFLPPIRASSFTSLPAVEIERRHLLAASALMLAWPRVRPRFGGTLSWDQFLVEAPKRVGELAQGKSAAEQDAYLFTLAALAAQLERVPGGKLSAFAKLDPKVLFGVVFRGTPFFVVEWRLEPKAVLPAHCHPGASVCTLALEGAAEIRHYEVEPGAPAYDSKSEEAFTLRETRRQRLRPGAVSTLSTTRDNLHWFRAGTEGARGIDISTMHGGDGSFSFVDFDPETPQDPRQGLYEALWVGQEPR